LLRHGIPVKSGDATVTAPKVVSGARTSSDSPTSPQSNSFDMICQSPSTPVAASHRRNVRRHHHTLKLAPSSAIPRSRSPCSLTICADAPSTHDGHAQRESVQRVARSKTQAPDASRRGLACSAADVLALPGAARHTTPITIAALSPPLALQRESPEAPIAERSSLPSVRSKTATGTRPRCASVSPRAPPILASATLHSDVASEALAEKSHTLDALPPAIMSNMEDPEQQALYGEAHHESKNLTLPSLHLGLAAGRNEPLNMHGEPHAAAVHSERSIGKTHQGRDLHHSAGQDKPLSGRTLSVSTRFFDLPEDCRARLRVAISPCSKARKPSKDPLRG